MKKYPSRIRYEKRHPTISFRLDSELKERLEEVLEGKSFADFVKEGLGVREREKVSLKNAYKKGYDRGFDEATEEFGVYSRCTICGAEMIARAPGLKKALGEYIMRQRWGHEDCMEEAGMFKR